MQFLLIGYDGEDENASERRLAVREQHLALSAKAAKAGDKVMGGAILDDEGNMKGSMGIFDFDSRDDLEEWLKDEPYINGKVWQRVEVYPFKIAPSFQHVLKKDRD